MTSSPPIRTSPTVTTVSSGLNVRLASLYGSEMRTTSCTPSSISISPGSGCPCPTAPSTVRVTPVERCTSIPISTSRATTCSICASVARSSITTTMASVPSTARGRHVRVAARPSSSPCTTRRSSRRASSMIRSNSRAIASGPSGPSTATLAHVLEHLLLAIRLIDLDALLLLQPADLARRTARARSAAARALRPPDRCPVRKSSSVRMIMASRRSARALQPAHVGLDPFDRVAATRSPRQSATPARCRPPPHRRTRRPPPRAPAARCRIRARSAASCARESAAPSPRRRSPR